MGNVGGKSKVITIENPRHFTTKKRSQSGRFFKFKDTVFDQFIPKGEPVPFFLVTLQFCNICVKLKNQSVWGSGPLYILGFSFSHSVLKNKKKTIKVERAKGSALGPEVKHHKQNLNA